MSSSRTRVGTSLRPGERLDLVPRQAGLEPVGDLQHLPVGDVLAHVGQGRPLFQGDHVFQGQHLGHPPGGRDQRLVQLDEKGQGSAGGERLPPAAQQVVRLALQKRPDDARAIARRRRSWPRSRNCLTK